MVTEEKDIWETNSSRVSKVQLVTLLAVLLLNGLAQIYLYHYEVRLTREKWRLLLSKPAPADVLIVGDSSAAFSLNPDRLAEKSGLAVHNLATVHQFLALDDAWMFNQYVRTIGTPKALILMRHVPFWELNELETVVQAVVPLPWKFWQRLDPGVKTSWAHNLNFLLARYVPFYLQSNGVKKAIRFWRHGLYLKGVSPTGAILLSTLGPDWKFKQFAHLPDRLKVKRPFRLSELNLFALESIRKTCERTGTTLILVNSPLFREDAELDRYREYIDQAKGALGAYASSSPSIVFLMQEPLLMEKDDLYDSIHTRASGAEFVTDSLYEELKLHLESVF